MPQPLMSRNSAFTTGREPLQSHSSLELARSRISGPFNFLNPTQAHFRHLESKVEGSIEADAAQPRAEYRWTSRNNRKGRHQIVTRPAAGPSELKDVMPKKTNDPAIIGHTIGRMLTNYPYYDISWLVAYVFTWGSIIWVINAFFVWLPLVRPSSEFKNEITTAGGITAFIGATVFELGSVFLMLEAINANREGCFGWAVHQVFNEKRHVVVSPDPDGCSHHHRNKRNLVGKGRRASEQKTYVDEVVRGTADEEHLQTATQNNKSWIWHPTWYDLKTHYVHEIGFLACSAQMFGATIFWISGFTALPGILNHLSPGLEDGIYWTPQVVGGSGFIVSGTLFMIETQEKWYKPAFHVLGWYIGFWNLVGGVGFTLCPAFGYNTQSWAQYQASLSTFWGSWAFLIGSLIQLYESLQKHPVEEVKSAKLNEADAEVTQQADQA